MRTLTYQLRDLKKAVICIGFEDENNRTQIRIDCGEVFSEYPNAAVTMKVQAPKGGIYPATVTRDGDMILWTVRDCDVANKGNGEFQLTFTDGTTVIKTCPGRFHVDRSLKGSGTAPSGVQDWLDNAEKVLEQVESAEIHQPMIGLDGYWYKWDQENGEYVKTDTKAQGEDGDPGQPGTDATPDLITKDYADLTFPVAKDSFCYHDGKLYQAKQDIQTSEAWTAAHWQETTVEEQLGTVKSAIQDKIDKPTTAGTAGQVLVSDGNGGQVWGTTGQGTIVVDDTLSVSGAAADAAKVGDLKSALIPFRKNLFDKTARTEGVLKSDGTTETNASYVTTDYIKCYAGQIFTISPSVRSLCGYDSNKTFRSGSFDNSASVNTGTVLTYTTPYDGYIRFSLPKASTDTAQIEWGNSATGYIEYGVIKLSDSVHLNALDSVIADEGQLDLYVKDAIKEYSNLIDKTATENGYISNSSGNITESTSYETTDYIFVKAGVAVTFAPRIRAILAYDASKNPITSTFNNTTVNNDEPCTFTPTVTGYVRATMYVYDRDTWQCVVGTTVGTPEPFGKYISPDVAIPGNDILAGKKWVVCGDSFTNGADTGTLESGDYAGEKIVYPYIIGNRTHINVIKFFKNGQTLAFPAEPGTFVNSLTCPTESYYFQNIPSDADYITIYLGINDSHHAPNSEGGDGDDNTGEIPLGEITDSTTETYYGAWNVVLTWLLTNRPFAHIGIIVSNGCDSDDYRLAQIAIAQKYGIPYLDLNGDDRCRAMIRSTNPNISNTVKVIIRDAQAVNYPTNSHPNNLAHMLQSTFIEAWLRTL